MRVGMLLDVNNHTVDPATLGRAAEEAGFESLWVGDAGIGVNALAPSWEASVATHTPGAVDTAAGHH
jgi:alkanesulfonate monooxygenase SsuD/methylene tetrahydromethanopterin reductase-like flavin-dependent oxidoreductase (luciferase family)